MSGKQRLTPQQWIICIIAAIGFAFDTYVLLVLPLIVRPALLELINARPGSREFNLWIGMLYWVPAMAGGSFGLIGGYLTDLFGRRRVLVWSIWLYALSAVFSAFVNSPFLLLFFRCTTFIGVCVEFVAAVAWLAELFPDARQRDAVLGHTQTVGSIGGLMVSGGYYLIVMFSGSLPAINGSHEAWRYTLMSGVIPAIPLIVVRPFLPESPSWMKKKAEGTLARPSIVELFRPAYRKTAFITALMVGCSFGAAFGALQMGPQIVPGLEEVKKLPRDQQEKIRGSTQLCTEVGGLTGRILLTFLAVRIVSRRKVIRIFQVPGLILIPLVFLFPATHDLNLFRAGIFIAGLLTIAQFSFWGNYLPLVYPIHLRGTGEAFAANVGGRMLGTFFAFFTSEVAVLIPSAGPTTSLAYAAAGTAFLVYSVGLAGSFLLPEPSAEELDSENAGLRAEPDLVATSGDRAGIFVPPYPDNET